MHTLFVREHNYWAKRIKNLVPNRSGEDIHQLAKSIVTAEIAAITFREFLPLMIGEGVIDRYSGYEPTTDARISNEFSTAAYRFGHSKLSPELQRLDRDGEEIEAGHLSLREAFFQPAEIIDYGIERIFRGLAHQRAQNIDLFIIDDVRNFLFGPPGSGGFDLATLNIQRGRDHGLPDYNTVRSAYGLSPISSLEEITDDTNIQTKLASVYDDVKDIDLWVGGLAETHASGAMVGETYQAIIKDQFERLRNGDRFWYERRFPRSLVRFIHRQSLSKIIKRNTTIGRELSKNVFLVEENV